MRLLLDRKLSRPACLSTAHASRRCRPCKQFRRGLVRAQQQPGTPQSAETGRGSGHAVESLNSEQLTTALADRDRPIVIDFSANWCGPCLLLAQELEKVAKQLGDKVRLIKIDTDENPQLSSDLQIQGLPTMVFVGTDKSKPALRTEGLLPAETIISIIQNEL
ncbi:hypothetical protein WJX73_009094 [Symbiochloris irregularis]|uniref:Thioredoxin domain-containing protein n=1 Tax=Symbiochloris irregularis TaxID=706552 RepID=A0AAW1Q0M8_9CHLO